MTSEDSAESKRLKQENAELKRINAILRSASAFFRGRRPAKALIVAFIDEDVDVRHEDTDGQGLRWGVGSICEQLAVMGCKIAPRPTTSTTVEGRPRESCAMRC